MTTKARAALQRKIVRLEVGAVMTERFFQELQAAAPSARTSRNLRANRRTAAALADELVAARARFGIPTDALPPDSAVPANR